MNFVKRVVKLSVLGGTVAAAYGLGVANTLNKVAKDKPFYRRYRARGNK